MSYYSSYYSTSRSSSRKKDEKKKKRKIKKSDIAYFVIGFLAYPVILHFLLPGQQITFGKNVLTAILLGVSSLFASIISHRILGITEKYTSLKEYGKFFLVFMIVFSVVVGYTMKASTGLNKEYINLVAYAIATFAGVYASAPKKSPKSKVAVITIVIGYIIFAGVSSVLHL